MSNRGNSLLSILQAKYKVIQIKSSLVNLTVNESLLNQIKQQSCVYRQNIGRFRHINNEITAANKDLVLQS